LHAFDETAVHDIAGPDGAVSIEALIGGVVTRAGPVATSELSEVDQSALSRLALRPVFVGVERDILRAAINDDLSGVRRLTSERIREDEFARADAAGDWIVPLGAERWVRGL
jgi:hypothetical protein